MFGIWKGVQEGDERCVALSSPRELCVYFHSAIHASTQPAKKLPSRRRVGIRNDAGSLLQIVVDVQRGNDLFRPPVYLAIRPCTLAPAAMSAK